jgi:hypothetical protein
MANKKAKRIIFITTPLGYILLVNSPGTQRQVINFRFRKPSHMSIAP